jgi:radical SAM protein with 4Fe4S-binding SPASM domain
VEVFASRRAYVRLLVKIALRSALRRQLTPYKLANLVLNFGYAVLRKPVVTALPSVLQIDINNRCNLQCPSCPTGLGQHPKITGEMSYDSFCRIVDEVQHHVFLIVLYNSGEPFMHKDVYRMIEYAHRRHIAVVTSTNGHFFHGGTHAQQLVASGLDVLIVSISGISQETYSRYHVNGHVRQVIEGLRKLTAAKRALKSDTPAIILRYLTFDYNRRELGSAQRLARELGVDYLNIRQAASPEEYQMVQRATSSPDDVRDRVDIKNHCFWLWSLPMVQYDGDVKPCCFLTLNPPDQGNVFRDGGVSKVWRGERFRAFRRAMLTDKGNIPSCKNCPSFPGVQDYSLEKFLSRFRQRPATTVR